MAAAIPLLLFLSAAISAAAQVNSNTRVLLGSSLTPTIHSTWLSPSGIFGFGFHQTPDGYVVGIVFDIFAEKTVVWTANRENPIIPGNAVLILTNDGVVLKESYVQDGCSVVAGSSQPTAWASMLDNGNFVLYNFSGGVIWQSFDHPTDSLLPGQCLPPEGELISRASETDFKTGTSRLKMQGDADLVLYYVESLNQPGDSYYSSGTYRKGRNVSLNLDDDGYLYLFDGVSVVLNLTPGGYSVEGAIYLARLDWDGIIRLYIRSFRPLCPLPSLSPIVDPADGDVILSSPKAIVIIHSKLSSISSLVEVLVYCPVRIKQRLRIFPDRALSYLTAKKLHMIHRTKQMLHTSFSN